MFINQSNIRDISSLFNIYVYGAEINYIEIWFINLLLFSFDNMIDCIFKIDFIE